MIEIMNTNTLDKAIVDNFLKEKEIDKNVIAKGKIYNLDNLDAFMLFEGIYALGENDPKGIAYYKVGVRGMEIVKIYTITEDDRIKNILLKKLIEKAKEEGCSRIWSLVTNDKVETMEFLQRNGFEMKMLHENLIEEMRKNNLNVYEYGLNGIKISHGLEFVYEFTED